MDVDQTKRSNGKTADTFSLEPFNFSFKVKAILRIGNSNTCFHESNLEVNHEQNSPALLLAMARQFQKINQFSDNYILKNTLCNPYTLPDTGLINPKIKNYDRSYKVNPSHYKSPADSTFNIVVVTLRGHIDAAGFSNNESAMSMLEAALLGYVKEYNKNGKESAQNLIQCIKQEFTSKKENDNNIESRTPETHAFLQQYMKQCVNEKFKNLRIAEYIRLHELKGDEDPIASVELRDFEVYY